MTRGRVSLTIEGQPLGSADDLQPPKPLELLPFLMALGDREIAIAGGELDDRMLLENGMH